jgi:hypothetical protein
MNGDVVALARETFDDASTDSFRSTGNERSFDHFHPLKRYETALVEIFAQKMTFFDGGCEPTAKLRVVESSEAIRGKIKYNATLPPQCIWGVVVVMSQPSSGCRSING